MYKIDNIDCQIVNLLMKDGRMPASEISRELGDVSERVVRYRIERLVTEEIIRISAIPNPNMLGYSVVADVFIEVESSLIEEIARRLTTYDFIRYVACSIGESDISVQLVAHDADEVYEIATGTIGKIAGVRKTTTSIVPLTLKDIHEWSIPESICAEPAQTDRRQVTTAHLPERSPYPG
jgi:Lrp/AsnC family transcriptional regulator for asnA, asnC and gidA